MTREQFIKRWSPSHLLMLDLEAVIATEIAKVQPKKTNKIEITPHTLVEVNRAFRALKQDRNSYIHKVFSDDGVFDAMEEIRKMFDNYFVEQPNEQPALNHIAEAYHNYKPIRWILWNEGWNIKKHSDTESIDRNGKIYDNKSIVFNFDTNPEEWELYTEPDQVTDQEPDQVAEPAEQPSSQVKLDNSFDKDRFERLFSAVVISYPNASWDYTIEATQRGINKLDAYYATKEGGANE